MFAFKHSYSSLPERFYAPVNPTRVSDPSRIKINSSLAQQLGLDPAMLETVDGVDVLSGNSLPNNAVPIAMAYAGHQFGGWVPSLGDGRAILLGELDAPDGIRYDIQLKGSGPTPFSRRGDGRAWLGPVIREYLVSEAMHHLGIPTTRALAAILTGDTIYRDTALPGAILTRVARSHLRVGTFQYFFARNDIDAVKILADYLIDRVYPHLRRTRNPYLSLLEAIIDGQARLVAQWMGVGFIHGVMNTDNTSLSCETIDYGPCAFMDVYQAEKVFSSIDHGGRYAYGNQPHVMHWNLAQLATTLVPLISDDKENGIQQATEAINRFPERFNCYWLQVFGAKLGLAEPDSKDQDLISRFLASLQAAECDFTLAFRTLSENPLAVINSDLFAPLSTQSNVFDDWLQHWKDRLGQSNIDDRERQALMQRSNPSIIPRNHQIELAISEAINGDFLRFNTLAKALSTPYENNPEWSDLTKMPKPDEVVTRTFCGT